ncbi:MAG: helix-turn-helix transcriptional regulator [Syntrophaceae bacterium]
MERTLKALRVSRKLSLKELAHRVGCAAATLSVYEINPPAEANPKIIQGLSQVLAVTPEYILKLMGSTTAVPAKTKTQPRPGRRKASAAKAAKPVRSQTGKRARQTAGLGFTPQQTTLMTTLIRAEIKRLREFIVQAEGGAAEDKTLKSIIQDTYADLQALQALNRLIVKGKTD